MDPPRNACFDRTTRIHCLCKACVSGSCLYCDHDQSIKAQRGYWQGACSSVSFTLPLFVCVCVCFCESQTKPLSPCTSSIPLCVCKHLLSLSLSLSLPLISVLLGWSQRLWMNYFWRFLLWKDYPLPLHPICLCLNSCTHYLNLHQWEAKDINYALYGSIPLTYLLNSQFIKILVAFHWGPVTRNIVVHEIFTLFSTLEWQ